MDNSHGTVFWSELMTRDTAAARDYYSKICGWSWDKMPMPEGMYHIAKHNGQPVAGVMDMADDSAFDHIPPHWLTYLAVEDVDAAAKATVEAGGHLNRDIFDVHGIGRIAIVTDPTGAVVGLMTPAR